MYFSQNTETYIKILKKCFYLLHNKVFPKRFRKKIMKQKHLLGFSAREFHRKGCLTGMDTYCLTRMVDDCYSFVVTIGSAF